MKIAAFQALVPKKSLLKHTLNQINSTEFYNRLDRHYKRKAEAFWIIRIATPRSVSLGVISLIDIIDAADNILPHEGTIPKKIQKTIQNIKLHGAQINPILLLHKEQAGLKQFIQEVVNIRPEDYAYTTDNTSYAFWRLNDRVSVRFFENHFAKVDKMFIADGHHRHAAQWEIFKEEPSNYNRHLLAALMPISEMDIIGYHRIVKSDTPHDLLLNQLSKFVEIERIDTPEKGFSMYCQSGYYKLRLKSSCEHVHKLQEVSVLKSLQDLIFPQVFDIDVDADAPAIKYVQAEGQFEEVLHGLKMNQYLFRSNPVSLESFVACTESGEKLPPKSTRFTPRMQKGLIVHKPRILHAQVVR